MPLLLVRVIPLAHLDAYFQAEQESGGECNVSVVAREGEVYHPFGESEGNITLVGRASEEKKEAARAQLVEGKYVPDGHVAIKINHPHDQTKIRAFTRRVADLVAQDSP